MKNLLTDLRYALRTLRRSRLFTIVAIASLALGIGANTAIFTLLDQIVLRKLPIQDPGSLVMVYQNANNMGNNTGLRMNSYPLYQDFQSKAEPFSEVLCRRLVSTSLSADNRTERVEAEMVSGNYFSMLGVKPAIGRVFDSADDDQVFNGHPEAVLSYSYWTARFANDPKIVGKKILVNNHSFTIIGVSAEGFAGLDPAQSPQIRVPILMEPVMLPDWTWLHTADRRTRWVQIFARLKSGYTLSSAQAVLQGLYLQIRKYEMTLPAATPWSPYYREQFLKGVVQLEKADNGYSDLRNSFSQALIVLMCMVGLVLLIACANVANLLIARALSRQKEISIRLSLGATRWQLVRQLLLESMVLSVAGGAAGILVAFAATRALLAFVPAEGNPLMIRPQPDGRILLFTAAVTVLTGFVFGLAPALRASRLDLWSTLKAAVGSIAGTRGSSLFLRKGLIAAQVALSFLLLFGAGLFLRSLDNLKTTRTGFRDLPNLVTFQLSPALSGYDDARAMNLYRDVVAAVKRVPGVQSAAFVSQAMLNGDEWDSTIGVEGHQIHDGEDMQAWMNSGSPGYFQTMGIPMLGGRDFDARDLQPNPRVAIVNQEFERHFFGEKGAVGRHIGFGDHGKLDLEIIGVVANSLYQGPREGIHRQVYLPKYGNDSVAFYARTVANPQPVEAAVREAVQKLDPALPVFDLKTLEAQLDETLLTDRLLALLSAGFGLLATLLAAIGLYGVMAFVVGQRTKELGVRLALGARRQSVIWLVMKEALGLLAIGLAVGAPSAIALGRLVSSQLYNLQGSDPTIALFTIVLLTAVAAAAAFIPAHRASRIDPILAIRFE